MSTWALVGSPNSGKTTLYNWLTGSKSKAVNYPGSTVEYNLGILRQGLCEKYDAPEVRFVDTPGVYSLIPKSEDEAVTANVLFNTQKRIEKINGVIVVLDGVNLSRHLYLAKQVMESGYPVIFVVTMRDIVESKDSTVDLSLFKTELSPNVVLFDGVLGKGLDELIKEILSFKNIESFNGTNVKAPAWNIEKQTQVIRWAEALAKRTVIRTADQHNAVEWSNRIDRYLLHPVYGFLFFFVFMTFLFSSIYWMAKPVMDLVDSLFSKLGDSVTSHVPGLIGEFLGSGFIGGLGGVAVFVPQIFILALGIGILESTGYLARVAALIDKPLSMVGLGGRSFVPLLSGFACAIPAIMATRNISSRKERLIAQCIIPFMTCSARLPVYVLLIGFLVGDENPVVAGLILALLYFGAVVVGAVAAHVISLFIDEKSSSRLLMELPLYRRPKMRIILFQAFTKAKLFLLRAGPIILILSFVLWFGTNFPRPEAVGGAPIPSKAEIAKSSYAAQVGQFIEPVFKPMGVDWRVGFGLISAFAAREVFVSALAVMFNVDSDDEKAQTEGLLAAMDRASFPDGNPIFTVATVTGIIVFFMVALQCTSTVGILRKETGSWKPALLQLFFSNLVAYNLAVVSVTVLRFLGF